MRGINAPHHFAVVTAKCGSDWITHDPYTVSDRKLLGNTEILGIRPFVPAPSNTYPAPCAPTIFSWLSSPAELLITDPNGNKTGFNPVSGLIIKDIPESGYFTDTIDNDETGEIDPHPTKQLGIPNPIRGKYTLEVIGIATGTYTLGAGWIDQSGVVVETIFKGVTTTGSINSFELNHSSSPGQALIIERVATFDSMREEIKLSLLYGLITNQGIANSLLQKMNTAEGARNKGNLKSAGNILDALVNEIEAQANKHINKDASGSISQGVQYLKDHL